MEAKKIIRYFLSALLITGIIMTVGFLSFTGMLLITPLIPIALGSFFFAAVVEGEVYKQNILAGMKKLFSRQFFKKNICQRELDKQVNSAESLQRSTFLRDYKQQLHYVNQLKKAHTDKQKIKKATKRLNRMKAFFAEFIFAKKVSKTDVLSYELDNLLSKKQRAVLHAELMTKRMVNYGMSVFYILSGVSCSFASVYAIQAGFITLMTTWGLTLSPLLLFSGVIPLAILAGLGYGLLMYHTVTNLIANKTLQKVFNQFKQYFIYHPGENKLIFSLKILGLGLLATIIIGLSIFATVATAGTWWLAVKQGARLLPYISALANWIRNISVPAMVIPTLLFNLKNSLSTLKKIGQFSLSRNFAKSWQNLRIIKAQENWLQFINPFRLVAKLIELPIHVTTFILHLLSICVMSDRLEPVPPIVTSGCNLANETLVDAHYFMENENHHDHDHQHGTLIKNILTVILSPIHFLSAVWSWASDSNKEKSFLPILKQQFGIKEKTQPVNLVKPQLSNAWYYQEKLRKSEKGKSQLIETKKCSDSILCFRQRSAHSQQQVKTKHYDPTFFKVEKLDLSSTVKTSGLRRRYSMGRK